jgi:hypothetical protein
MVSIFYVLQNSDFRYFFVNLFSNLFNNNIDNYLCLYDFFKIMEELV